METLPGSMALEGAPADGRVLEGCSCQPQTCSNLQQELAQLHDWGGGKVVHNSFSSLAVSDPNDVSDTSKDLAYPMGGNKTPHSAMFGGF